MLELVWEKQMYNPVTEYFNANAMFESLFLKSSTWAWSI